MNDDTDKLAAEMKNLKPSKASRTSGLDAAMAAFGAEFGVEASAENVASEKNSTSDQGLADAARPTGTPTKTVRAKTRRVETMNKFTSIFQKPQAMMMAGTCGAALIAALVVLPNMDELAGEVNLEAAAPIEVTADVKITPPAPAPAPTPEAEPAPEMNEDDAIVVTGSRVRDLKNVADTPIGTDIIIMEGNSVQTSSNVNSQNDVESFLEDVPPLSGNEVPETISEPEPTPAPVAQGGISSVDSLLNDITRRSATPEQERVTREFRAALQKKDNLELFVAPQGVIASSSPPPQIQSTPGFAATNIGRTQIVLSGNRASAVPPSETFGGLILEEVPAEYEVETKEIVTKEATTELVVTPPSYETVTETVVVEPARVEYVETPTKYEWVDGEIEGHTVELIAPPIEYETVSETVIVQEASTELASVPAVFNSDGTIAVPARVVERVIPPVTKTQTRRVIKNGGTTIERKVPYERRDGKTRVPVIPGVVTEKVIPPVTKEVTRRVIKTPASTVERHIPAGTKRKVQVRTEISPQKFYLRDEDGNVVQEFDSRDAFEKYKLNTTTAVSETPVSTFSVDVDTASYSFLRAAINRGQLPPRESIRLEEMINYFPYNYEAPKSAQEPFKANVTVTQNPWNADTKLMHIGIKGYVPKQTEKPRSNLVFLIDTSGSMNQPNKLPLLVNSFKLLLNTLDEDDTVSIVAYASASGTVLEPTAVKNKSEILNALNNLRAGGSTAGAAGLELAYQKAQESFDDEGVNRVILATDGDFNVGFSSPDEMKDFIKEKRETGIFLSVLGFGMGNYNDHLMQSLAQNGNGVAAYIDTLSEANKVLANEAGSALFTIAKDVKIQVEFNPATIAEYRLIGYETRALKRQDFNNDKVDAGEIGAGHSVTAIYEMTPVGSPAVTIDKLRYASAEDAPKNTGSDEYAFVKIRHKLPNADKSTLQTFPIGRGQERRLNRASDDMRFAMAVSIVGQKLRGDMQVDDYSYADAIKLAQGAKGEDEHGYRAEFIQMVKLIEAMGE